jgi:hypothetical protein
MGATDISAVITASTRVPNRFQQMSFERVYDIDVTTAAFTGIETVATHDLVPIPLGYALVGGTGVVQTSFAGSSTTVTFGVGSDALSGDIPEANLAAGDTINLDWAVAAATESKATYAKAAADTLDWTIGTAALTAGRIILVLRFLDVSGLLTNG